MPYADLDLDGKVQVALQRLFPEELDNLISYASTVPIALVQQLNKPLKVKSLMGYLSNGKPIQYRQELEPPQNLSNVVTDYGS